MKKRQDGHHSELMDLLIAYKHSEMFRIQTATLHPLKVI